MEVIVAKTAGFCFGVKRAVEQVYEQIEKAKKPVYTMLLVALLRLAFASAPCLPLNLAT